MFSIKNKEDKIIYNEKVEDLCYTGIVNVIIPKGGSVWAVNIERWMQAEPHTNPSYIEFSFPPKYDFKVNDNYMIRELYTKDTLNTRYFSSRLNILENYPECFVDITYVNK